jgi:hypothetical protein
MTAEEREREARQAAARQQPARHRPAHWDELVHMSFKLSCGCIQRSDKVKVIEAATVPGHVLICKRCDEFAVCVKVTTYLEYDASVLARLLVDAGVEPDDAEYVASVQT